MGPSRTVRTASLVAGVLLVAAVAVTVVSERRDGTPDAVATSAPPAGDPGLVKAGEGVRYEVANDTRNFVLQVEIENLNRVPVRVQAAPRPPEVGGIDRMVVAVLAGGAESGMPGVEMVMEAAGLPFSLEAGQSAQLTVSAHLACAGPVVSPAELPILVDGQQRMITMPPVEGRGWVTVMAGELC